MIRMENIFVFSTESIFGIPIVTQILRQAYFEIASTIMARSNEKLI